MPNRRSIVFALAAAVLFGVSTPAAKFLVAQTDPWLTAGLLYLGSGTGLGIAWLLRRGLSRTKEAPLRPSDLPWLAAAIASGGVVAPVLLMFGLARAPAAQASLLLNLEGVLTAVLAWVVFREHFDRRIAIGMGLITIGAFALAWQPAGRLGVEPAALLIVAACLGWAIDNNLTRKVSGGDPVLIAAVKGGAAGTVRCLWCVTMRIRIIPTFIIATSIDRRTVARHFAILTSVTALTRLLASTKSPSRVTEVLRTMLPPPGIAQLWNFWALGSKRTTVFGVVPDSLYQMALLMAEMP